MATSYPTWDTWKGHGRPVTGYFWGYDPVGPTQGNGLEYNVFDQGPYIFIQAIPETGRNPVHQLHIPESKHFWWSSDMPSVQWWAERNAKRRREIADRDDMKAITAGPIPPGGYITEEEPWDVLIGRRVTIRIPTRELPSAPPFYKKDAPDIYDPVRSEDSRAHMMARRQTMPVNHDAFRHPLQGKPHGQESDYSWLLGHQMHARACGDGNSVIACDWRYTRSAMLRIEPIPITAGPTVHVITVNGQIFQWGMDQRFIMHLITSAQGRKGQRETAVFKEDAGAQPAPGQAEDNVVITLECGHEIGLQFDPSHAQFYCAGCRRTVDRARSPEVQNPQYEEPIGYRNVMSCGHTRMLNAIYAAGHNVRCFECLPGAGILRKVVQ